MVHHQLQQRQPQLQLQQRLLMKNDRNPLQLDMQQMYYQQPWKNLLDNCIDLDPSLLGIDYMANWHRNIDLFENSFLDYYSNSLIDFELDHMNCPVMDVELQRLAMFHYHLSPMLLDKNRMFEDQLDNWYLAIELDLLVTMADYYSIVVVDSIVNVFDLVDYFVDLTTMN